MIQLINVSKVYKTKNIEVKALKDINLLCQDNGLVSIIGPSGCGKTTLLNLIGGLDNDYTGEIIINNEPVVNYSGHDWDCYRNRHIGFVFQSYNLINHLSIYQNIELALSLNKLSNSDKKQKIEEVCLKVGILDQLLKRPSELSGGQLQRAAIARALVNNPSVILADEPTGALDSKTSVQVMEILKEVSLDHLVLLVTHNEKLANTYSNRIVYMLDGMIIEDKENVILEKKIIKEKKDNKIKATMALKSLFSLSATNLMTKKIRSLLTVLACSIGIIGLCIVLNVVNGMSLYISDVQKQALGTYPVTITSVVDNEEPEREETVYKEYPNNDVVHVTDYTPSYEGHVNVFTNEFLDHVRNMPNDLYTVIGYTGWLKMHILSQYDNTYKYLSAYSYMKELNYKYDYIDEEYDLLAGSKIPTEKNEVALVIDKYNCISRSTLNSLGIYTGLDENFEFSDFIGKEYKVISNNDYYAYNDDGYYVYPTTISKAAEVYNKSELTLEITAILRQKSTAKTNLYGTTLLYTSALTDHMLEQNLDSDIVKAQIKDPLFDVFNNVPYVDVVDDKGNVTQTIAYQIEYNLGLMGATFSITRIVIYTDKFEKFSSIQDYIYLYNENKTSVAQIKYRDYLQNMTDEFELFMNILTTVLVIFALISLVVAAIMIVIITYVSVLERVKEIGILRSVGIRKIDIGNIFLFENAVIGFMAGILGTALGIILLDPIVGIVIRTLDNSNVVDFDFQNLNFGQVNFGQIILLVVGSIILTVISGLVPAIMAANKSPIEALKRD